MKWIIQSSGKYLALERNILPLIKALNETNTPYDLVGLIPFTHEITGFNAPSNPAVFYGSTTFAEVIGKQYSYWPGSFWNSNAFNPVAMCSLMANTIHGDAWRVHEYRYIRQHWFYKPMFIKPVYAVKLFSGQVVFPEDKDTWIEEHTDIDPDTMFFCSQPINNIEREWRFWVIDGKVVTGSLYKKYKCSVTKEKIPDNVILAACEFANSSSLPLPNIVMDICQLSTGEFKLVEFNCIGSSGFYNACVSAIVKAINKLV